MAHNEEKVKRISLCFICSYVEMDVSMLRHEKRTFSLSQMNNVELARTSSWRENALFEEREKNVFVKPNEQCRACSDIVMARKRTFRGTRKEQSTCPLVFLLTCQLTTLCQLFRKKFNIMSALFTNQSPTLPQKIDSREGLF